MTGDVEKELEALERHYDLERAARKRAVAEVERTAHELAAATALLERCRDEWGSIVDGYDDPVTQGLARDLAAHLDGQPEPARAQRRVLEAMAKAPTSALAAWVSASGSDRGWLANACDAELARRAARGVDHV